MDLIEQAVPLSLKHWPEIEPYLSIRARCIIGDDEIKTYEYYLKAIDYLVRSLYYYDINAEFVDTMNNLIETQLTDAYNLAMKDMDMTPDEMTPEMQEAIIRIHHPGTGVCAAFLHRGCDCTGAKRTHRAVPEQG